ncbi:hypothetical protein M422DRAFT_276554 [Sphaerobolus stellatus SS14]|uniref:DUF6533 domain-containing protein n=1 Tax=Sphaerobolus stellatus (strain SS14) TaxID=990650 RepID=A0A0C9UD26_SPHS4|nr:hypothetical protein M422DRAFT_276554 [Sphaerobolus stellatus SS14]
MSSSHSGELEPSAMLTMFARDLLFTKYSIIASLAFLLYDHLLTLPLEIHCFWDRKWSSAKVLYLLTRYSGIAMVISYVIMINQQVSSPLYVSSSSPLTGIRD